MEKEQNDEVEIDLVEIFTLLKEKIIKIFGIGVILAALIGIGTLFLIKPKYESTSKLYIVGETNRYNPVKQQYADIPQPVISQRKRTGRIGQHTYGDRKSHPYQPPVRKTDQ